MRLLSDRTESDSQSICDREDELIEDSSGWDDPAGDRLDGYIKAKGLDRQLIKLANNKMSLQTIFKQYRLQFNQKYSPSGWTHSRICPFKDHADSSPSFHYNPQENRFNCFGCQRGGKAVQFIAYMENKSVFQIAKDLLNDVVLEDLVLELEIENEDSKIRDALFDYASYVSNFVEQHNCELQAIKYAEAVTWPLDAYVRNHLSNQSIVLEQLDGRISLLKEHLAAYGDDDEQG